MTQGPEDEWFDAAGSRSPTDTPSGSAEDDWLVTRDDKPRATRTLDFSVLDSPRGLAAVGVVVLAVVALVAVVLALGDSTPSSAQIIPIASAPTRVLRPSHTAPTTTAPVQTVPAPTTTLKPGDSGPQVKTLQRELQALGFSVGTIDGSYGSQTSKAVAAFQRAHHLTADGIVGPATLTALAP